MKNKFKIKIGKTIYNVEQVDYIKPTRLKEVVYIFIGAGVIAGEINYQEKRIKIRKKGDEEITKTKKDTLFHEIAHGVLKELENKYPSLSDTKYNHNNEKFVDSLGAIMQETFKSLKKNGLQKKIYRR